jgi:hypothetical protein
MTRQEAMCHGAPLAARTPEAIARREAIPRRNLSWPFSARFDEIRCAFTTFRIAAPSNLCLMRRQLRM